MSADAGPRSGGISAPRFETLGAHHHDALAAAIAEFTALFRSEFSLDVYLTWGTLLGAVREGDFIAHDSDVDLAYLSAAEHDFEIVEEHELVVRVLRERGFPVERNSKGQIHVNVAGDDETAALTAFNFDVWTTWTRDGRYFHYPDIKGELAAHAVRPLQPFEFRGHAVLVPACPTDLLAQFYGQRWDVPDAGYAWYPRYHSTDVFEFLRNAPASVPVPARPRRAAHLAVDERDGFFFVTAPGHGEPQRLNASAMLILELCTGNNSTVKIIDLLQQAFALPSAPEVVVLEFLTYAVAHGLLA